MTLLLICALVSLVIFLLIDRRAVKISEYWRGHEDGYFSAELTHAMLKKKGKEDNETDKNI